jgi:hypothetical protein
MCLPDLSTSAQLSSQKRTAGVHMCNENDRVAAAPQSATAYVAVVGSIIARTSVMVVAGNPEISAWSRIAFSFSAR